MLCASSGRRALSDLIGGAWSRLTDRGSKKRHANATRLCAAKSIIFFRWIQRSLAFRLRRHSTLGRSRFHFGRIGFQIALRKAIHSLIVLNIQLAENLGSANSILGSRCPVGSLAGANPVGLTFARAEGGILRASI